MLYTHYGPLQCFSTYFRKLKEIGVLRPIFPDYVISCDYDYLYDDYKVKPLHIMLPKTSAYVKSYDGQTKWMYILIKEDNLLEKCNTIWNKVSVDIKKEFDRKHVYKKKI